MIAANPRRPRWIVATICIFLVLASPAGALPPPSPSPPLFQDRPFGPRPAPTPPRPSVVRSDLRQPIPRGWIVAGAGFAVLAGGAILFFAIRAWRVSRLFGRQYLFPVREKVALRLGGERSGGLMATARFGDAAAPVTMRSKSEDA